MSKMSSWSAQWAPQLLSVLRIITAFLLMEHGTMKLFGFPALMGFAGVLEVFGGLLILIGLFTRPVAFLLSGEMAFAYFMAHAPQSFWPVLNHGEAAVFYCFAFLYLAAAGAGPWSADHVLCQRHKSAETTS